MAAELRCQLDRVGNAEIFLTEVRRYLAHHHFTISQTDERTVVGQTPPRTSGALVDPLHVADEVVITAAPLESGALRVEGWMTTRGQTRTLAITLAAICAVTAGLLTGLYISQSATFHRLISGNPENPTLTLALVGVMVLAIGIPVGIVGVLIILHVTARRRAVTLLRVALNGLPAGGTAPPTA